jgi:hypothetical protein
MACPPGRSPAASGRRGPPSIIEIGETKVPSMLQKHVLFGSEAREKVLRGATAIADAVRVALGP